MNTEPSRSKNPRRILVTGGAGFIGSHTVDLLLDQGKEVIVLDNLSSGKLENLNLQNPDLEFIEGDVLEYPFLEELLMGCDAVLHLAAIVSVPQSIENPIYSLQVNTQGFLHVLEAVRRASYPIRIVNASSAAVYGNTTELPCRDDTILSGIPLSPYALQKAHVEDYAALYLRLHGIKSLALRYFNVYGSRQDPRSPYSGVISRFLEAYKNGSELTIFGDGQQSRDFIHVTDVAKANSLALHSDYAGVLNIATGQSHTLLQLIDYMQDAGKRTAEMRFEAARAGDIQTSYASTLLAERQIGFKYSVKLNEGMRLMLE
ncbi:MAG: GDP-mannose 4,6-dehydratase [Gammaproteobacteria bacterium]|nr:GDP-mannose 4,6-dehydratase [Gammaproteobacteria bacterium]MCW5582342.1 GDP-mannose 4,6-dehydratase [Gammaproteobacteria bacterium]